MLLWLVGFFAIRVCAADEEKPKVAVFPLSGNASDAAREKVGFALRAKLNRDGSFDAIDGPTMSDLAGGPAALNATPGSLLKMVADEKPAVMIWGELNGQDSLILRVKVLDLRQHDAQVREIDKTISAPQQLRFAVESILETIADVKPFVHPSETGVTDDRNAAELWKRNPNLLVDGDFAEPERWAALLRSDKYPVQISDALPATDRVCIYGLPNEAAGAKPHNVLAMRLSEAVAEGSGLACISEAFAIEPKKRYRISFRYRSDGPTLHVFVKGYYKGIGIDGAPADIEDYRRQVPPSPPTDDKWVTIVDDLNPHNPDHEVKKLRVDLYAYMSKGVVMFDDVIVKAVGQQSGQPVDDALRPASTQP